MRVPVLVYALLYLVIEMIGAQLAEVQWTRITPLMVAAAVTDAMVVVAMLVAALVAADLSKHRWRPVLHSWLHAHGRPHSGWWGAHRHDHPHPHAHPHDHAHVVGVTSWRPERPERPALPMGSPSAAPTATYAAPTYAVSGTPAPPGRPFAEDDDHLL